MLRSLILSVLLVTPVMADPVKDYILPATERFAAATEDLAKVAAGSCDAAVLQPAWNTAMDAFLDVQFLNFGPVEAEGRAVTLAFWPDPKGIGQRQMQGLLAAADPAVLTAEGMAQQSAAVRGLVGLERMVFADPPLTGTYPCALIAATAADLDVTARAIRDEWPAFAQLLATAGEAGNTTFLSRAEATQTLFTPLMSGLEFVRDRRIGRPLGTFDAPAPQKAEMRAAGRGLQNITRSLQAMRAYTVALAPQAEKTLAAFDSALLAADAVEDGSFANINDPQAWLKLDILRQRVEALQAVALDEVGGVLGAGVGFNAADGD
jgi:uncharacterized protein